MALTKVKNKVLNQSVDTINDLPETGYDGQTIEVLGYTTAGDGGGGLFRYSTTSATNNGGTIINPALDFSTPNYTDTAGSCWHRQYSGAVNVKWFGAKGDNTTDDTDAIQTAIDNFNNIFIQEGDYLVRKTDSTDGHFAYGLKIDSSDKKISGIRGKTNIRRFNSDISTYALAYPLLWIGGAELSDTSTISDCVISEIDFYGNDTRHSSAGSALSDLRYAIQIRGAINLEITKCTFRSIDSGAIIIAKPQYYSYKTSSTINLNNYSELVRINNNTFYGSPHTTTGRAYLKAIWCSGANDVNISSNTFSWCDSAIASESTYDILSLNAPRGTSTYTSGGANYLRCGRELVINGNTIRNSSEHSIYLESANSSITGNVINSDSTYCYGDIKIRGQHIAVGDNSIVCKAYAVAIHEYSRDISVVGNTIECHQESEAGVISIDAVGIKAYIDARDWFDTTSGYFPMENIVISNNVIEREDSSFTYGYGLRIDTDNTDNTNFPNGFIRNVTVNSNTFNNMRIGVYHVGTGYVEDVNITNNVFNGASFTVSGFDGSDLKGYSVIGLRESHIYSLQNYSFIGNIARGYKYIFGLNQTSGAGPAGGTTTSYHRPPFYFQNNRFNYFLDISEGLTSDLWNANMYSDYVPIGNVGNNFVNKNTMFDQVHIFNSIIKIGDSDKQGTAIYDGTNFRFYYGTAGLFKTL